MHIVHAMLHPVLPNQQINYVVERTWGGALLVNGKACKEFSQDDIEAGTVVFEQRGSEAAIGYQKAGFDFIIKNNLDMGSTLMSFNIDVTHMAVTGATVPEVSLTELSQDVKQQDVFDFNTLVTKKALMVIVKIMTSCCLRFMSGGRAHNHIQHAG